MHGILTIIELIQSVILQLWISVTLDPIRFKWHILILSRWDTGEPEQSSGTCIVEVTTETPGGRGRCST
jgi:hypothetical protein